MLESLQSHRHHKFKNKSYYKLWQNMWFWLSLNHCWSVFSFTPPPSPLDPLPSSPSTVNAPAQFPQDRQLSHPPPPSPPWTPSPPPPAQSMPQQSFHKTDSNSAFFCSCNVLHPGQRTSVHAHKPSNLNRQQQQKRVELQSLANPTAILDEHKLTVDCESSMSFS